MSTLFTRDSVDPTAAGASSRLASTRARRMLGRRSSACVSGAWLVLFLVLAALHLPDGWGLLIGSLMGGSLIGLLLLPNTLAQRLFGRLSGGRDASLGGGRRRLLRGWPAPCGAPAPPAGNRNVLTDFSGRVQPVVIVVAAFGPEAAGSRLSPPIGSPAGYRHRPAHPGRDAGRAAPATGGHAIPRP